jgi:hypothetical protein
MKELIQYFENLEKQLNIRNSIFIQEDHYIGTEKTWVLICEMNKVSQYFSCKFVYLDAKILKK